MNEDHQPEATDATRFPLVTCILPTENRARFIKQAIQFFTDQDYPNKEMLILFSKNEDLPVDLQLPPNVSVLCTGSISLGAKRNYARDLVKGEIIAQWDDDDIYHPLRLSEQIAPLLTGESDITGLQNVLFYEVVRHKFWSCSPFKFKSMFDGNVACGTIVFKKSIWGTLAEYPDVASAEDGFFLVQALRNGARLKELNGRDLYIYVRHRSNTWRFHQTFFRDRRHWKEIGMPVWVMQYENFYREKSLFNC